MLQNKNTGRSAARRRRSFFRTGSAIAGLLCILLPLQGNAAVKTISISQVGTSGNYTVSWTGFSSPYFSLVENGVTIQNGGSLSRTFTNKAPGTYTYLVGGCEGAGYNCGPTQEKTVVVGTPEPPKPRLPRSFNSSEIQAFLDDARGSGLELADLVNQEVAQRLHEANIVLDGSGVTYSEILPNEQLRGGCTANVSLRDLNVAATISSESEFKILMDSLSKPILAKLELIGSLEANGKVRIRFGAKLLGKCIRYARKTFDASTKVDFTLDTSLAIMLNPVRDTSDPGVLKIKLDPKLYLSGKMSAVNSVSLTSNSTGGIYKIPLAGDLLNSTMNRLLDHVEDYAVGQMNDAASKANTKFAQYLSSEQSRLQAKLREHIPSEFVLPISPQHENEMLSFVSHYALGYLPPSSFLKAHGADIIYALLTGDVNALKQEIATAAVCNATADAFSLNMPKTAQPGDFKTTSRSEFCGKVDNKLWLGNAEPSISGYNGAEAWTLMPSTRIDMSTVSSIKNNYQPYTRRVQYRTINGINDGMRKVLDSVALGYAYKSCYYAGQACMVPPNPENFMYYEPIVRGSGTCKLEMRIYKKTVSQSGLKPLLAIHGGAWKYRGAGFYGLESQVSHFTEQGFVVFAPFYRLTGEADGNIECNNASGEEIVADIEAALQWVNANKTAYGVASGEKIRLFGQSAGAHLAGWLATHKSSYIQKALLMYPPTDAKDYITEYKAFVNGSSYSADYEGSFSGLGLESLEAFLGPGNGEHVSLETIDTNSSIVQSNSFPGIVAFSPSSYPPVFLVHGKQDKLVPSIQSVRMCNAYAGSPYYGPASNSGTATKSVYSCGQSQLHLLKEASHMLELCLPPLRCEAGKSEAALSAARESLTAARQWLSQ